MSVKRVTIKDLAKKLGIAPSTVSMALNDHPRISDDTIKRVRSAAEEAGYIPNLAAAELLGQESKVLGIVIPEMEKGDMSLLLRGIELEASARGYYAMICLTHTDLEREEGYLKVLFGKNVDGLLVYPTVDADGLTNQSLLSIIKKRKLPMIFLDRYIPSMEVSNVTSDNFNAVYDAIVFLRSRGHRRIAFLGSQSTTVALERFEGYKTSIHELGLGYDTSLVNLNFLLSMDIELADKYIADALMTREPPTAVICYSNPLAKAVCRLLSKCRSAEPGDMEIVGFDLGEELKTERIPLYSIVQSHEEMGRLGITMLLELIANGVMEPKEVRLSTKLVPHSQGAQDTLVSNLY